MKGRSFICMLAVLVALAACTKQESKENWNNIKDGTKNSWQTAKKAISEATEDFKESTE
jgi:outer membrane biogenesis lipoprotein LolB